MARFTKTSIMLAKAPGIWWAELLRRDFKYIIHFDKYTAILKMLNENIV